MVTAVSLFTGCGGSDSGLVKAGVEVLMANDIFKYAKDTYEQNFPETDYQLKNIKEIESFPKSELLVGCYPCQGFSQGGIRSPEREINLLYLEFARALKKIRPKAFIVENVSGMVRRNYKHLLDDQVKVFSELGYAVSYDVLNAADYGVPQDRRRIFIVGIRKSLKQKYEFPTPTHGSNRSYRYKTIKDAIGDLPLWPTGGYYDLDFHWYYLSRDRRRDWDMPSKTVLANPRHTPLHPVSPKLIKLKHNVWRFETDSPARRFSALETARLQGFGRRFKFPETEGASLNTKYKVAGNAVPPKLFEVVFRSLPDIWN